MSFTNPPPLKIPNVSDPQLAQFLQQMSQAFYLLWDQIGGRGIVPITAGGTGSQNASDARTALGLALGTDALAYDDGLASIAGLTTAADKMIYATALDSYAVATLTSFARSILDDADANAVRTTIDAEKKDAGLTSIAGLTTAANKMIYTTALDTYAVADLTAFARSLLDDSDAQTARATLGVGTATAPSSASDTGTAGTIAYDSNYIYVCTATDTWKRAALSTW